MSQSKSNPITLYYWAHRAHKRHIPLLPRLFQLLLYLLCNAVVPYRTQIGKDCLLGHGGGGVVIHPDAFIGSHVMICQQVTVGGRGGNSAMPTIGNDVYLGAGAKILGPITIGDGCLIGANAVVFQSVPPRCVVVGVPGRIVRENVDAHSIEQW